MWGAKAPLAAPAVYVCLCARVEGVEIGHNRRFATLQRKEVMSRTDVGDAHVQPPQRHPKRGADLLSREFFVQEGASCDAPKRLMVKRAP
ncbi:hypothetical protein N658DRAFT_494357 [Parathielavia hyrcaniae]|uniref:Uncharacterized protein n=1 Tax=Parathielavia hyrcaniae TaxID=113614 RepID=A0AAN6Q3V6_9PEZI|nr:hypothetical protein N658DRAFT_494357 [Parathielavia hyrcaniae]